MMDNVFNKFLFTLQYRFLDIQCITIDAFIHFQGHYIDKLHYNEKWYLNKNSLHNIFIIKFQIHLRGHSITT